MWQILYLVHLLFNRQSKVKHQIHFFVVCAIKYGMLFDELISHLDWRVYRLMMCFFIGVFYVESWPIPLQWRVVTHHWAKWYRQIHAHTYTYCCKKMRMEDRICCRTNASHVHTHTHGVLNCIYMSTQTRCCTQFNIHTLYFSIE